jgi:hypothetical protein
MKRISVATHVRVFIGKEMRAGQAKKYKPHFSFLHKGKASWSEMVQSISVVPVAKS